MQDPNKMWMNNMMNMAWNSMETGMKTMNTMQDHANRTIDMTMNNTATMQEETRSAVKGWMAQVQQSQEMYAKSVREGWNELAKQFDLEPITKTTKNTK